MADIGQILSTWILSTINIIILVNILLQVNNSQLKMIHMFQVPSLLVLATGLTLMLTPVTMTSVMTHLVSQCHMSQVQQQFLVSVISTTLTRHTGGRHLS